MVVSNRNLLFQGSIFRGYVSFREGTLLSCSSFELTSGVMFFFFGTPFLKYLVSQRPTPRRGLWHQERPIESLPSTDPLPFELRVAVFKVPVGMKLKQLGYVEGISWDVFARELRIKGK